MREVKAQTRVLKSHLEQRRKRPLEWTEPPATWLVRQSANCFSTCRIQADGKTPDQRRTRKRWRRHAVEFGEKAAFLLVAAKREGRLTCDAERMVDGIFRWSSRAHWRVIVLLRAWTAERHESSVEDRGPTVRQRVHPKVPRSSVDAQWRGAGRDG